MCLRIDSRLLNCWVSEHMIWVMLESVSLWPLQGVTGVGPDLTDLWLLSYSSDPGHRARRREIYQTFGTNIFVDFRDWSPATSWCLTGRQYTFVFIAVMVEDHFALLGRYLLKDRAITNVTTRLTRLTPIFLWYPCFELHSPMSCNEVGHISHSSRYTWCSSPPQTPGNTQLSFQPSTQDLCFLPLERRTKWLVLKHRGWTQVGSTENTWSLHSDDTMSWRQAEVIRSRGPCWRHPAFTWSRVVYLETWLHSHGSRWVDKQKKQVE